MRRTIRTFVLFSAVLDLAALGACTTTFACAAIVPAFAAAELWRLY